MVFAFYKGQFYPRYWVIILQGTAKKLDNVPAVFKNPFFCPVLTGCCSIRKRHIDVKVAIIVGLSQEPNGIVPLFVAVGIPWYGKRLEAMGILPVYFDGNLGATALRVAIILALDVNRVISSNTTNNFGDWGAPGVRKTFW